MDRTYVPLVAAKPIALKLLPQPAVRALRNVYYWYLRIRIRAPRLVGPIAKRLEYRVQDGPFAGMVFPAEMVRADIESPFLPKLLGCYELECQPWVEELCSRSYDQVINIGAGEGYYAVGLARRMPGAKVIAFEIHDKSRELCAVMTRLNGVEDRVEIRGACDVQSLAEIMKGRDAKKTLVVCDCEGAELDLLQPAALPFLAETDLLVELHDFVNPAISETIRRRFTPSHEIEMTRNRERDPDAYPALLGLSADDRKFVVSEHRLSRIDWLFGTSHARAFLSAPGQSARVKSAPGKTRK